jgi:hypothetical protein
MKATALPVTGTGAVRAGPGVYRGLRLRDTSGATNTVKVFDNASAASGTILFVAQLAANATTTDAPGDGMFHANGLFLQTTGTVEGSVWT